MRNYIIGFVIGVAVCLFVFLSFQAWRCFGWRAATVAGSGETEIVLDSIYVARSAPPVHITGRANSFVWRSDSVSRRRATPPAPLPFAEALNEKDVRLQQTLSSLFPFKSPLFHTPRENIFTNSEPRLFTAQLDTIFRHDTISVRYEYPENLFTFSLHPRPDSVLFKQIVVRPKPEPWWVKPVLIVGGVAAGVIIGRSVSN